MIVFYRIRAQFTGQKIKRHVCKIIRKYILFWHAKLQFLSTKFGLDFTNMLHRWRFFQKQISHPKLTRL